MKVRGSRRTLTMLGISLAVIVGLTACTSSTHTSASQKAQAGNQALQKDIYQVHNNVEFNNYNERQKIADDPTTILWCTAYFNSPNDKPLTYPIVGKLTSSNKRPYATSQVKYQEDYNPEIAGPDKMYGSSSEYRYGFTPGGVYVDFTGVPTVCSTQPTVYQAQQTQVVLTVDSQLNAAANLARQQLKAGQNSNGTIDPAASQKAANTLQNALKGGHK